MKNKGISYKISFMLKLYNTLSRKKETFYPIEKWVVRLYTCGPTVYDFAHIGNFRSYIFGDLLKRYLKYLGYKVIHVMNITDVDDKTIAGARDNNLPLHQFTDKYIEAFLKDIKILNIQEPDFMPRATEHLDEMIKIIKVLLDKGFAYKKDGSVYFRISSFPKYGELSQIPIADSKTSRLADSDEYGKENVADFALWKLKKENEPYWDTEIGAGRPGWHIECSAMSMKYLGETFDVHAGGNDLIFPHHENEIAQSESFSGKKFVNFWLHCSHLIVNGEKMSKSKGNFYTLRDLLSMGFDPMDIRFLLISTHYRNVLNFTFESLNQANASLKRIKDFLYEIDTKKFPEGENPEIKEIINKAKNKFEKGLNDDLNISIALTAIFESITEIYKFINFNHLFEEDKKNIKNFLSSINNVLGILPEKSIHELPEHIISKIKEREEARKKKDFEKADAIRDELFSMGIILEDAKDGVRWKIIKKEDLYL
ncbi:MAG: cysteine--tRNA ligase [Acidobacteriota bacterium]